MRPSGVEPRMRLALTSMGLLLLTAGCVDEPEDTLGAASVPEADVPVEPFGAEGTVWLPPSSGEDRVETLIPFPVNASGSSLVAELALGSRYGPLDLPPVLTDVLVELRAPDGTVLAEGALDMQETQARLEARAQAAGEHVLALLSYGGSDEQANGDFVDWRLDVTPAP